MQDVTIWRQKRYLSFPRLCRSDGETGKYRRYCSQFYPQSLNCGQNEPDRHSMRADAVKSEPLPRRNILVLA